MRSSKAQEKGAGSIIHPSAAVVVVFVVVVVVAKFDHLYVEIQIRLLVQLKYIIILTFCNCTGSTTAWEQQLIAATTR